MPNFELRERSEDDLEECVSVLRLVHEVDRYPVVWPKDAARWLSPGSSVRAWVAVTRTEELVGHVLLCATQDADTLEVSRLFVSPRARGAGLGAALLDRARAWAEQQGRRLELEVVADERSHAIALYEREGWRRTGTVTAEWTAPDGGCVVLHRYVR